jgi:hypothetical protein
MWIVCICTADRKQWHILKLNQWNLKVTDTFLCCNARRGSMTAWPQLKLKVVARRLNPPTLASEGMSSVGTDVRNRNISTLWWHETEDSFPKFFSYCICSCYHSGGGEDQPIDLFHSLKHFSFRWIPFKWDMTHKDIWIAKQWYITGSFTFFNDYTL